MNRPHLKVHPLEISLDTKREGGRIAVKFRYEHIDGKPLDPNDGQTIQAFADLLATIGAAVKLGRTPEEIQASIAAAQEAFDKIQAARAARQPEETPTHG